MTDHKTMKELMLLQKQMIFSASGWRGLLSAGDHEESLDPAISEAARILTTAAAVSFCRWLKGFTGKEKVVIAVGTDTRPTGPELADPVIRGLASEGAEILYAGITAAPEITAWVQKEGSIDGFFYISASHNPPGYNGFKFGAGDGSVLEGIENGKIHDSLNTLLSSADDVSALMQRGSSIPGTVLASVMGSLPGCKARALARYREMTTETAGGDQLLEKLAAGIAKDPLAVVIDFNGSARCLSIDRDLLASLGIPVYEAAGEPGMFLHPLIPEGESLLSCAEIVGRYGRGNPPVRFGYVPDTDGDRGNLVIFDEAAERGRPLRAQEVFALTLLSELCWLKWLGRSDKPVAVAVNGPTSLRSWEIASRLGASVFEAEVGEANVVGLARKLERKGYLVRILGEGSNGGNITFPSVTRDPINTVLSVLKLRYLKTEGSRKGLFDIWREASGLPPAESDLTMAGILETLPVWTTTEVTDPLAICSVQSPQADLKRIYEDIFLLEWELRKGDLEKHFGIVTWEEINNEGSESRTGFGPSFRSGNQKGCFKILFRDRNGEPAAFLWMRGSGTEPVFRVMAELKGDSPAGERLLLQWHRSIIEQADQLAGQH
jgi:phosphoglucomutase